MRLWCVKNEEQLAALLQSGFIRGEDNFILPLMPKVALAMHSLGMKEGRLPIEFLTKGECEAIQKHAVELSKSWHRHLNISVEHKGIDLIECCRIEMMGFFQDVLAAEAIAPRLIKEYKPKDSMWFKRPSIPSFDSHMHDGTSDVFEAVLQWRFQESGINVIFPSVSTLPKMGENLRRRSLVLYKNFRKALGRFKGHVHLRKRGEEDPRRIKLSDLSKTKPLLVGFGSGYDLLIIWPYLKAFAQEIGGFPVVINRGSTFNSSTLRSGLVQDEEFRFIFEGDIPLTSAEKLDLRAPREKCLAALTDDGLLHESLQNPLLRFQFSSYWDSVISGAFQAAQRAMSFFTSQKPVLYLDDYCAGHDNRAWAEAGNLAGVTTVTVPHGAINQVEFYDFMTRWALAWGEFGYENWGLATPMKREHVIISGDPSMDTLSANFTCADENKRNRVLLLTGGFLHQAWADMDVQGVLSTWEEIASIARQRPFIEFIIKPHPSVRDLGNWYDEFVKKKSVPNLRIIADRKLEELLPTAFLAILVGKVGTAALVANLAKVPFVFLDTMVRWHIPGYRIWRDERNGVPRLTDPRQLLEVIDRVYSDHGERCRLLASCAHFCNRYLQPFQSGEVCKKLGISRSNMESEPTGSQTVKTGYPLQGLDGPLS